MEPGDGTLKSVGERHSGLPTCIHKPLLLPSFWRRASATIWKRGLGSHLPHLGPQISCPFLSIVTARHTLLSPHRNTFLGARTGSAFPATGQPAAAQTQPARPCPRYFRQPATSHPSLGTPAPVTSFLSMGSRMTARCESRQIRKTECAPAPHLSASGGTPLEHLPPGGHVRPPRPLSQFS